MSVGLKVGLGNKKKSDISFKNDFDFGRGQKKSYLPENHLHHLIEGFLLCPIQKSVEYKEDFSFLCLKRVEFVLAVRINIPYSYLN